MKPILEITNISKKFRIRHKQKKYLSLRESITELFKTERETVEDFYALQNVSFEVLPGESLGIIGKNGAGKSTLLKILSKITPPTSGKVIARGRIASLLEVGTGFHQELSGRENIFLNGSILGMKRKEIQKKFDEIVDFSGTEKFLDTALKHYSSGMQLRLAFAVAAFLEPEILIIDEVLAVGDFEFQKKCLGKMERVAKSGRTILFVSHNLSAVSGLCSRCLLLDRGKISTDDITEKTISNYLKQDSLKDNSGIMARVIYFNQSQTWECGEKIILEFWWEKNKFRPGWQCDIAVYTFDNVKIFALESYRMKPGFSASEELNHIEFEIINPGLVHKEVRVDWGIRYSDSGNYEMIINNILAVQTGITKAPAYWRPDVLVVPQATVNYSTK